MEATHKPNVVVRNAFSVPKQEQHSSIAIPRQPKWDCFGLFKSNSISPERIKKREQVIEGMSKKDLKKTIEKAEHDEKQLKYLNIPVPDEVKTNKKLLKKRDARLTSTIDSVVEEKNIPQKVSKFGWLMYNRLKTKK